MGKADSRSAVDESAEEIGVKASIGSGGDGVSWNDGKWRRRRRRRRRRSSIGGGEGCAFLEENRRWLQMVVLLAATGRIEKCGLWRWHPVTVVCMAVAHGDRLALLEFKHSIKDDFKVLSSWVGVDCCSWKGVSCDDATKSVAGLHLRGNYEGLFGSYIGEDYYLVLDLGSSSFSQILISNDMTWVSRLFALRYLDLSGADFSQSKNINAVLSMITSLTYLSLQHCELSNVDLGFHLNSSKKMPIIEHLDLSLNFFQGQLPHFFQNLTSLTFLHLSYYNLSLAWNTMNLLNIIPSLSELRLPWCSLHSVHFSPTYFNVSAHSNVHYLELSHNSIEGRFPSELTNMTSLRVLDLSENGLNSSVPVMPNLLKLDVSSNKFEHIELVGIWRQCHLKELSFSGNYFGEEMIGPSTNMSECSKYALEMLDSNDNGLKGSIPESIERLTNLRVLRMISNELTGSIPKALERLRPLEVLDLSYNNLTGPIPTFLGKLTELRLPENQFTGSIPESLGRLASLTHLDLRSNYLTGLIPPSLGRLTFLVELNLGLNQLTGPIPTSLGRLASLQEFLVFSNLLNGTLPISLGQLSKLAILDVSNNSLGGVLLEAHFANLSMLEHLDTTSNHKFIFNISHEWIPPFQLRSVRLSSCKIAYGFPQWLQTQRKLEDLVVSNTSLHGNLPTWLQKMPVITYLDLSHNQLSGSLINLPSRNPINGFESGEYLLLHNNLFNGSIPMSLCRRTNLVVVDVSRNRLSGKIPDCFQHLQQLSALILNSNELFGVLPSSLGNNSSSLAWIKLNDNNFNGKLPRDLKNLRFLRVLDLGNNEFFGNIPKWIGEDLTYMMVLRLHKNNFVGRIPQSLCRCSNLQILDVANNNLTGSIPHCFGKLHGMIQTTGLDIHNGSYTSDENQMMTQVMKGMELEYTTTLKLVFNMDLSSNKLTGQIPQEITALTLLVGLNVSHNHLTGTIPDNIGYMKALNSLDLSDNRFTGMIPSSLAALNFLSYMNLSHNNLSGRIPTGNQLQTIADPSMYAGNMDLCGAPLLNNCSNHENTPTTSKNNKEDADEPNNLWFYVDILCGFATGFWGIIGVLLFKKQWRKKLFMFAEVTMDNVFVAVALRVAKIKRVREGI
ncbi:hypothetical protein E3N88_37976 [Mikania micrantha]|uniref:Uncharacterized protein n=1 Tax=Mikania micrantha TaxID=192012 RepID=A0A5N6LSS9_9ASTR|nr:hypothetical protein E3N88_37976 [Mikania micrantha]